MHRLEIVEVILLTNQLIGFSFAGTCFFSVIPFNPRPDGPLDFPPLDGGGEGGVETPQLLTRHLDVEARNRKMRSEAREKLLRK